MRQLEQQERPSRVRELETRINRLWEKRSNGARQIIYIDKTRETILFIQQREAGDVGNRVGKGFMARHRKVLVADLLGFGEIWPNEEAGSEKGSRLIFGSGFLGAHRVELLHFDVDHDEFPHYKFCREKISNRSVNPDFKPELDAIANFNQSHIVADNDTIRTREESNNDRDMAVAFVKWVEEQFSEFTRTDNLADYSSKNLVIEGINEDNSGTIIIFGFNTDSQKYVVTKIKFNDSVYDIEDYAVDNNNPERIYFLSKQGTRLNDPNHIANTLQIITDRPITQSFAEIRKRSLKRDKDRSVVLLAENRLSRLDFERLRTDTRNLPKLDRRII